jgi:hypothetical protein
VQKRILEQAVENLERIRTVNAVGLVRPPGGESMSGNGGGSSSFEWNEETHNVIPGQRTRGGDGEVKGVKSRKVEKRREVY